LGAVPVGIGLSAVAMRFWHWSEKGCLPIMATVWTVRRWAVVRASSGGRPAKGSSRVREGGAGRVVGRLVPDRVHSGENPGARPRLRCLDQRGLGLRLKNRILRVGGAQMLTSIIANLPVAEDAVPMGLGGALGLGGELMQPLLDLA